MISVCVQTPSIFFLGYSIYSPGDLINYFRMKTLMTLKIFCHHLAPLSEFTMC